MSAKKLGRFTAGLFVALGLAFGGAFAATAAGGSTLTAAESASSVTVFSAQFEYDWS